MAGRLFTYNFNYPMSKDGAVNRNYYDVGLMRFRDNPVMQRLHPVLVWLYCSGVPRSFLLKPSRSGVSR